jgi:hypothetical protein
VRRPDGFSPAETAAFERTLGSSHYERVRIEILDRDEQPVEALRPKMLTGTVDVDVDQAPSRSAEISFVDHAGVFDFAPNSPAEAAAFADTFLAVTKEVYVEELAVWARCPVIRGPITSISRRGPVISCVVEGKEILGLAPAVVWTDEAKVLTRNLKVVEAIRRLMHGQGERRFGLPETPQRTLRDKITLDRMSEPWLVARRLANGIDRQLFYDGDGRLRLRTPPADRVFAFVYGQPSKPNVAAIPNVLERPELTFDLEETRNVVDVVGARPEGKGKKRPRHVAISTGPLSPSALARNGEPRWLVERIEIDEAKRDGTVRDRARAELTRLARVDVSVSFEALGAPHLEERDPVALWYDGRWIAFELRRFSIPLVAGERMSIGFNRRPRFGGIR